MSTENKASAPNWNPEIQPFHAAAQKGQLLLGYCLDCAEHHFFPRSKCPFCHSLNTEWRPSVGRGSVYSFSIQRRVPQPYVIAYVTLDEGPTMMTHIVGTERLEDVHIGQAVEVSFRPDPDGIHTPVFQPRRAAS
ncbi:OB-fold domain-containing protein [Hydrogenophaga sp. YM1]|uniref:Zn-ribbon domain-containing OB-fold protein n=1 Tax=Hydrogenophaga sp. YM1 TaxID=2806262 RepID=UPI001958DD82|nr:OB-fold domain-containing protein [Hydrogenophaga sp. YM1]QRR34002.1 OB-fold domain-containing protein [Hydrogenophaga sp. YM1]